MVVNKSAWSQKQKHIPECLGCPRCVPPDAWQHRALGRAAGPAQPHSRAHQNSDFLIALGSLGIQPKWRGYSWWCPQFIKKSSEICRSTYSWCYGGHMLNWWCDNSKGHQTSPKSTHQKQQSQVSDGYGQCQLLPGRPDSFVCVQDQTTVSFSAKQLSVHNLPNYRKHSYNTEYDKMSVPAIMRTLKNTDNDVSLTTSLRQFTCSKLCILKVYSVMHVDTCVPLGRCHHPATGFSISPLQASCRSQPPSPPAHFPRIPANATTHNTLLSAWLMFGFSFRQILSNGVLTLHFLFYHSWQNQIYCRWFCSAALPKVHRSDSNSWK